MPDDKNTPIGMNVAMLWTNETDTATCVVQIQPDIIDLKFDAIGQDEGGPFLVSEQGQVIRIGVMDRDSLDEALGFPNLMLHVLDEAGLTVEEYAIESVRPENAPSFGA